MILHASENQQAFVKLHAAIKSQSHLHWLVERIDKFSDESVIELLQHQSICEPTGCVNTFNRVLCKIFGAMSSDSFVMVCNFFGLKSVEDLICARQNRFVTDIFRQRTLTVYVA